MTVTDLQRPKMAADTDIQEQTLKLMEKDHQPKSSVEGSNEDLSIYEDDADCDDLSDNEGHITKNSLSANSSSNLKKAMSTHEEDTTNVAVQIGSASQSKRVNIEISILKRPKSKEADGLSLPDHGITLTPRSDWSGEKLTDFRAKTNTPVSILTDRSDEHTDRQSQGGASACREAIYQQALTLMSQRCVSVVGRSPHTSYHPLQYYPSPPLSDQEGEKQFYLLAHPYRMGQQLTPRSHAQSLSTKSGQRVTTTQSVPSKRRTTSLTTREAQVSRSQQCFIYFKQNKPSPMPPLKAWRGFSGNVYFEPIKVTSVSPASSSGAVAGQTQPNEKVKGQRARRNAASEPGAAPSEGSTDEVNDGTYAHSHPSGPTLKYQAKTNKTPSPPKSKPQKMVIIDKGSVYANNFDTLMNSMSDDIEWIVGQQNSRGSLCVQPPVEMPKVTQNKDNKKFQYNREKICRGSVAHKVFSVKDRRGDNISQGFTTTKMKSSSSARISPQQSEVKFTDHEKVNSAGNQVTDPVNWKLPPLGSTRAKSESSADPLASLSLEQRKANVHHPHPKDKPYVKYSRDVLKQSAA